MSHKPDNTLVTNHKLMAKHLLTHHFKILLFCLLGACVTLPLLFVLPVLIDRDNIDLFFEKLRNYRCESPVESDIVITMEKNFCWGPCQPEMYHLTIYGDGTVIHEGSVRGVHTFTISQEKVSALIAEFEKIDYFSLKSSYKHYYLTDTFDAYAITSLRIDDKCKTIERYNRDTSAPKELIHLENRIDEIVNWESAID